MSLFVKLDVNWVNHHKLIRAGLDGRGLHASALCLAKAMETDGWLHRTLLYREGADDALIDRLVDLRLLEAEGDNVRPWGWHDRNPSQGAIDATRTAKADAARAGNHKRWNHPGDVDSCPTCNPDPQVSRTCDRTSSGSDPKRSPESESETDSEAEPPRVSSQSDSRPAELRPDWVHPVVRAERLKTHAAEEPVATAEQREAALRLVKAPGATA